MKKRTVLWAIGFLAVFFLTFFFLAVSAVQEITKERPLTHKALLENDSLRQLYLVKGKESPFDFGFKKVTELQFTSIIDNTALSGWLIMPDTNATSCLIICHPTGSNRLAALRYLEIAKYSQLHNRSFVFLPDLRNTGSSGEGEQLFGYKQAEDITSAMMLINQQFGIQDFVLMGIGQTATACVVASRRRDLLYRLNYGNISVEKLILDSPLSSVPDILKRRLNEMNPVRLGLALWLLDNKMDGYLDKMRLSVLLKDAGSQVLVLQNIGDEEAGTDILLQELPEKPNITLKLFDGDKHAAIFSDPLYLDRYLKEVSAFLEND